MVVGLFVSVCVCFHLIVSSRVPLREVFFSREISGLNCINFFVLFFFLVSELFFFFFFFFTGRLGEGFAP